MKLITRRERTMAVVASRERRQCGGRRAAAALFIEYSYFPNQIETVSIGHPQIADDDVGRLLREPLARLID